MPGRYVRVKEKKKGTTSGNRKKKGGKIDYRTKEKPVKQ